MPKIINAKFADGVLHSFEVEAGVFKNVLPETSQQTAAPLSKYDESKDEVYDAGGEYIFPGMVDAHVHSRDPGLTHKEDWQCMAKGAFKGGVQCVFDMPNTIPPTMDRASVIHKAEIAAASGVDFRFFLGVGAQNIDQVGELLRAEDLPLCGLKVYYGQSTGELMYSDLEKLGRALEGCDKLIVFHSEDQCCIDKNTEKVDFSSISSDKSAFQIHSEIRSSESAHASTKVILQWAKERQRSIHIAHLSTPVELELIEQYRGPGYQITSEVAPHHLLFCTDDYAEWGPYIKMNPPVRSKAEKDLLLKYFGEGRIEVFATDHAPHLKSEKEQPYQSSPSGVPGVEYFVPLLVKLAQETGLSLAQAIDMGSRVPAQLFGLQSFGEIKAGYPAHFCHVVEEPQTIDDQEVVSKCGWSPYHGMRVPCRVNATWQNGRQRFIAARVG